jgi:hypothetical protein
MTCELLLHDARSVARIINLAHRFNCRCTRIDARAGAGSTTASFAFEGPAIALTRLRAQIDRLLAYEAPAAGVPGAES